MGVCKSPDIFQEKASKQSDGFDMVRAYIDDIIVINENNFKDHLKSLEKVLQRLMEAGIKVKSEKSFFVGIEMEYLVLWVGKKRVKSLSSKLEVIKSIDVPTKVCDVWRFVGIVNYYRDMWHKRTYNSSFKKTMFNES